MRSTVMAKFGWPFLVTLLFLGPSALLGSCENASTCGAKTFLVGPIILVAVVIAGFVAGRVSGSSLIGFAGILAAAGLVVSVITVTGIWGLPDEGASSLGAWLLLTAFTVGLMLPGFLIGRDRYKNAGVAQLLAQRDAGTVSPSEFERQLALRGRKVYHDQAPPDHQCGRCGKPLSPVWHGKCLHCGARYTEFPPVPRAHAAGPSS